MVETIYKPLTWADLMADPSLQDLPYKIELTKEGKIEMSPPPGHLHGLTQARIIAELFARPGGKAMGAVPVQTSDGVRAPDAAWISDARISAGLSDPLSPAPEICVEVRSPSNTYAELKRKAALFLEAGAKEVWIVQLDGTRETVR